MMKTLARKSNEGFSFNKFLLSPSIFLKEFFIHPLLPEEINYQVQWRYKKILTSRLSPGDLTEIVWEATAKGKLKSYFKQLMFSDSYYYRINRRNWKLKWEAGRLTDLDDNKEIFAYHFIKTKSDFQVVYSNFENEVFFITEHGVSLE